MTFMRRNLHTMMFRAAWLSGPALAGMLLFFLALDARAEIISCPASIATKQELQTVPSEWTASKDALPSNLANIAFYSGPPDQKASLVSDTRVTRGGLIYATWRFQAKRTESIWLSCSYSSTIVILSKTISTEITACTVTYNPKVSVAGLPEIQKIECK